MADSGSANSGAIAPPFASSSSAAAPDWEVLSMSMSASALQPSSGDDTSDLHNLNPQPENSNPHIESSFSQVDLPLFEAENPNPSTFNNRDMWTDPLLASLSRDDSGDMVAEPFTEGWKPYLSASTDLYVHGAEHTYGEGHHQEEALLSSQSTASYFNNSASMVMPEGSFVSEKEDAGLEEKVLSYVHSDNVEFDHMPKSKARCKEGNRPRKSSRVVWSIAVAATMVGIAVLGHRWRLACHHNEQLQLEILAKDQKLNDLLYQVNRLKEVVGSYQKVPVTRSSGL
eukprot:c16663_g1_i1 orf=387-1241(-)